MVYLFEMTLGPVQSFIISARRTRDLWYGSWLLSELSRTAATAIPDWEQNLIFPAPNVIQNPTVSSDGSANVANKIVAIIESDAINNTGNNIKKAVLARLCAIRNGVFKSIGGWNNGTWSDGDLLLANRQVADLLECYWAAVPFPDENDYQNRRKLLEEVISARKATRQFTQVQLTDAQGRYPKSSLDGQRESVISERMYPERGDTSEQRRQKLKTLYSSFGAKQAERLSGVDLLKRRGNHKADEADFPSTSHFAAIPFIEKLVACHGEDEIRNVFKDYRISLEHLITTQGMVHLEKLNHRLAFPALENYDASILYMSRLAEEIDAKDEGTQGTRRSAEQALQQFLKHALNGAQPRAYYAILQADGDGMGKVIDNQKSVEDHRALSRQLAQFAASARGIVEQHRGALVYSGGDDVLALLPVNTVLQCAHELHQRFDQLVGVDYRTGIDKTSHFVDDTNRPSTLSVGIAICHHLEPLNDALALARNAEKAAKQIGGKNGLAIAIDKRSGEPQMISGAWQGKDTFFERLQSWLRLMQDDELSAGTPYELRDLTERLDEPRELKDESLAQRRAIAEEAGRIIERKRGKRGTQAPDKDEIPRLREWLGLPEKKPAANATSADAKTSDRQYRKQKLTVRQLADELIVARELARLGAEPIEAEKEAQS